MRPNRRRHTPRKGAEMSLDQVAAELGIDRSTVYEHQRNGLHKMRRRLERLGITAEDLR